MATDLGTWPAEQATVLLEVLQAGGLHPEARRTRGEVHVSVPEAEGDKAHATLVANMDRIASAARPAKPSGGRGNRKLRAVEGGKADKGKGRAKGEPSRKAASPSGRSARASGSSSDPGRSIVLAIAVVGFGVAVLASASGGSPAFPLFLMTAALVWTLGKRAERGA